ncbi:MAG: MFS transporter [Oceanibaculum sp.]
MRATMKALAVLTFAVVLSQFFRSYLAVIAPEVMTELDLTPAMFGWLSSTFFLSFALAQIPVGIAFDRFGVRRPVALLLALGVAGAGTISVTVSYPVALAAQACLGLACAPLYMALVYYASHHLPEQRFVQAITLTSAIGIGGAFMAAAPLGWATYLFGWRPALAVAAVLTLLTLLAVWRLVGDERAADAAGGAAGKETIGETARACLALLGVPALWTMIPALLALAAGITFRNAWGGPYLADVFGLDAVARGEVMTFATLCGLVSAFLVPLMVRRWNPKSIATAWLAASFLAAAALALLPAAHVLFSAALIALLFTIGNIHPLLMAQGRNVLPPEARGRGFGVLNSFAFLGYAIASAGFGWIAETASGAGHAPPGVFAWIFAAAAVALLAALVPYLRSPRPS